MRRINSSFNYLLGAALVVISLCLPSVLEAQVTESAIVSEALDQVQRKTEEAATPGEIDVLDAADSDIHDVLGMISEKSGLTIISDPDVEAEVTIYLNEVNVFDALRIILEANDLAYTMDGDRIIRVMTADTFLAKNGYAFADRLQSKVIKILYVNPQNLLDVLNEMKSSEGKVLYNEEQRQLILMDDPQSLESMSQYVAKIDLNVTTKTFALKNVEAEDIIEQIREQLSKGVGRIELKRYSNSIIVTDTETKLKEVEELLTELDHKNNQLLVKSRVVQVILNDEHENGVDWEAIVSDYEALEVRDENVISVGTVSDEDFKVLIEALDTVGAVNTITEAEGQTSFDFELKLNPVLEDLDFSVAATQTEDDESEFKIKLKIKPQETIVYKSAKFDLVGGSTIVIGGFFGETSVETMRKIPLLGDLPLVGFAFRNQREKMRRTETILFITVEQGIGDRE